MEHIKNVCIGIIIVIGIAFCLGGAFLSGASAGNKNNNGEKGNITNQTSNLEGVAGIVADFLLGKGMPIEAVAAVLGNMQQESNFDPTVVDSYGTYHGLCQWGNGRWDELQKFAEEKKTDWTDAQTQVEFLWKELNSEYYRSTKDKLMQGGNVEELAEYFLNNFEGAPGQEVSQRQEYAKNWYDKLKVSVSSSNSSIETSLKGANKEKMEKLIARAIEIANDSDYKFYIYSQANRFGPHSFDCSSFCYRLYKEYFNMEIPGTTFGYKVDGYIGDFGNVDLQPGDILWRETHVELYIGNGKRAGAHDHYPTNPQDDISIKDVEGGNFDRVYRFIK